MKPCFFGQGSLAEKTAVECKMQREDKDKHTDN